DNARLLVRRHERVADFLEDDAVAAQAGQHLGRRNTGVLGTLAQQGAELFRITGVGRLLLVEEDGALEAECAAADRRRHDVQLSLIPVQGDESLCHGITTSVDSSKGTKETRGRAVKVLRPSRPG